MIKRFLILALLLVAMPVGAQQTAHAQGVITVSNVIPPPPPGNIITSPGWHKIPGTAVAGGPENATLCVPNNFPANLGSFTSYGFPFSDTCLEIYLDSNSASADFNRNRLLIWGGGHSGYKGNDVFSLEISNIGTSNPALIRLNNPANPFNVVGSATTVETLGPCAYQGGCFPTANTPGSRHTYDGIDYIPTTDQLITFSGATTPNGNSSSDSWTLDAGSVTATCAPSCNPAWTNLGVTVPGNVGVVSDYDPNTNGVWIINQNNLFFYNVATKATTNKANAPMGYHSVGVVDPEDKYFILIGPQGSSPKEGILYFDISVASIFTQNQPATTNCGGVTGGPNSQYQGAFWDPIGHRVVVYPNGTNRIFYIDPKTWICTSETYGSTVGVDFPPDPQIPSGDSGTFSKFAYFPGLDIIILCSDPQKDCWYLHLRRGNVNLKNTSGGTLTTQHVTYGQPFRRGDIPHFPQAYLDGTAVATQADVKNRWPDSSVKFAVVSYNIPSIASGASQRVGYDDQGSGNNAGFLTQAQMLASNYNFDAQIQLTGTASHNISARAILTAAGTCNDPGADPDGGQFVCTYWLKGPTVTGVILEDRRGRTFDVNTDGGTGNPLHPIFECLFYPGDNSVQVNYVLEDSWASTTAANSARNQTYSVVLTGGNTSPVTVYTSGGNITQITRTRWHKQFWLNHADPLASMTVDHNWAYWAVTRFFPHWDTALKITAGKISGEIAAYPVTGNQTLVGNAGGIGNYPVLFDATGAAEWHGPLTTWDIIYLLSQDPGMYTLMLKNAEAGNAVPYFYREADASAGHGQFFDATPGTGAGGTVATQGRVVSINARTQTSLIDVTPNACNTVFTADWINFGGSGQSTGSWGTGEMDTSHWPEIATPAYVTTGNYTFYEEAVMQAAYAIAASPGSRACTQPTNNQSLRMGSLGYWYIDQERGTDWQARSNALGAFIAVDGSPEQSYFLDKLRANLAVWEGIHNVTNDVGSAYASAWSYGNTSRGPNGLGVAGTFLGSWTTGLTDYVANAPLNQTGPNSPQWANAHFQNDYSMVMLGWIRDMGFSSDALLNFTAPYYIGVILNPASNKFHIADYVYPTKANNGSQITTYAQNETFYATQPSSFPVCNSITIDEGYGQETLAALAQVYNKSSADGTGAAAWNLVRPGVDCVNTGPTGFDFASGSPKWDITPRQVYPQPVLP